MTGHYWLRALFRFVNNSEQFRSDFVDGRPECAINHLGVHVQCRIDLGVPHQLSQDFTRYVSLPETPSVADQHVPG
jgi:hypothetical protein